MFGVNVSLNRTWLDGTNWQYAPWRATVNALLPLDPNYQELRQTQPYTPAIWGKEKAPVYITDKAGDYYVFDAIFRVEHNNSRRVTEHPVQTGANISDHSYQLPSMLTIEIGMSDVMGNYSAASIGSIQDFAKSNMYSPSGAFDWGGAETDPTKSVKAFEKIMEWQASGDPLSIETRLGNYLNMVVENVMTMDDVKTKHGLRCSITFRQIITAEVSVEKASARPQASKRVSKGSVSSRQTTTINAVSGVTW